jgi:hypothetical protein
MEQIFEDKEFRKKLAKLQRGRGLAMQNVTTSSIHAGSS